MYLPHPPRPPPRGTARNCGLARPACLLARREFVVAWCAFHKLGEGAAVGTDAEEAPALDAELEAVEEDERAIRRPLRLAVYLAIAGHGPLIAAVGAHDFDIPDAG